MDNIPEKDKTVLKKKIYEINRSNFNQLEKALQTIQFILSYMEITKWVSKSHIIQEIKKIALIILSSNKNDFIIENIFRRVLDFIRAEDEEDETKSGIFRIFSQTEQITGNKSPQGDSAVDHNEKHEIIQEILEFITEIKESADSVSELAVDHIHSREIIMTFGYSEMVLNFLKYAANFRRFEVIVAEGAPSYDGRKMAVELGKIGIDTILIPDSSVFAMMERTNKVITSSETVFASGDLMGKIGTKSLLMAARHCSVTVVVLLELYKLSPRTVTEANFENEFLDPAEIVSFDQSLAGRIRVENPRFDLVPAEYISLYVTSLGGVTPDNVYKLLGELYNKLDLKLQQ